MNESNINRSSDILEIDLWKLLLLYLRRWRLILLCALAAAVISLIYTANFITPLYRANVTIYVNNIKANQQVDYISAANLATSQQLVNTYVNIIRSDTVLEKVVKNAKLDYSAAEIRGMMATAQVDETELFSVYISHPDPEMAAKIANAVATVAPGEIEEFVEGSSTKIIDHAKVPTSRYTPSYRKNTLLGCAVGLLLAVVYVTLLYLMDVRIKNEEDLTQLFDLPMLGQIPSFAENERKKAGLSAQKGDMKKKHFSLLRRTRRHDAPDTAAIMEVERKNILSEKSDFFIRESYKTLRTNVTFSLADETACKVLIVTSAMQSEGKSITALNLAISYAEMKQRVLLIDCDLRRPKLARLLSAKEKVGLSNLLIQPELLGKAIHDSGIEDLDVIFAGDVPPNPSELLGSARMKALLDSLQENYDYIILDTSPVNLVTDACVLVPESSGVLFVVRAGLSERGSVLRAVEQLERSHAKILGFVLNEVTRESGYYGYRHGYGYGYGQEKPDSGERSIP